MEQSSMYSQAGRSLPSGRIELIFGPMFSGKSTELQRRIRRHTVARLRCLVIKYLSDTRYSKEHMATHDMQMMSAIPCARLSDVETHAALYDCIGIDEGQFFPDVVSFCEKMANLGKTVIVASLDGTFQRKAFGSVLELVPLAESVTKLSAVCMVCCRDASFTMRLGNETQVEVIGGADKYIAVCRQCFLAKDTPKAIASAESVAQSPRIAKRRANSLGSPNRGLAKHRRSSFGSPSKRIAKRGVKLQQTQPRKNSTNPEDSAAASVNTNNKASVTVTRKAKATKKKASTAASTPRRVAKRKGGPPFGQFVGTVQPSLDMVADA